MTTAATLSRMTFLHKQCTVNDWRCFNARYKTYSCCAAFGLYEASDFYSTASAIPAIFLIGVSVFAIDLIVDAYVSRF